MGVGGRVATGALKAMDGYGGRLLQIFSGSGRLPLVVSRVGPRLGSPGLASMRDQERRREARVRPASHRLVSRGHAKLASAVIVSPRPASPRLASPRPTSHGPTRLPRLASSRSHAPRRVSSLLAPPPLPACSPLLAPGAPSPCVASPSASPADSNRPLPVPFRLPPSPLLPSPPSRCALQGAKPVATAGRLLTHRKLEVEHLQVAQLGRVDRRQVAEVGGAAATLRERADPLGGWGGARHKT